MRVLYKFHLDCGRYGELFGLFVADDEDVEETCWEATGRMHDVLDKHSEVNFVLKDVVQFITSSDKLIDLMESYDLLPFGHNPLDYLDEKDCQDLYG